MKSKADARQDGIRPYCYSGPMLEPPRSPMSCWLSCSCMIFTGAAQHEQVLATVVTRADLAVP